MKTSPLFLLSSYLITQSSRIRTRKKWWNRVLVLRKRTFFFIAGKWDRNFPKYLTNVLKSLCDLAEAFEVGGNRKYFRKRFWNGTQSRTRENGYLFGERFGYGKIFLKRYVCELNCTQVPTFHRKKARYSFKFFNTKIFP